MKFQGMTLLAQNSNLPRWLVFPVGLLLLITLGFVAYAAPERMTYTLLYLVICMWGGWAAGSTQAVALAVVAALSIARVEWVTHTADPMPAVLAWNFFCHITVFSGVGWLTAEVSRLTRELHKRVKEQTQQLENEVANHKQSLEALKKAEKRYRSLSESSPDSIFILDDDLRFTYANAALAASVNHQPEELIGKPQETIFTAEVKRHHVLMMEKVHATGQTVTADILVSTPTGKHWYETRLIPLGNEAGRGNPILGIARDITERKRNEQILRIQRDVAARLSLTSDLKSGLDHLLELATTIEEVDSGGVYLMDKEDGALRLQAHHGLGENFIQRVSLYRAETPQTQLVRAGDSLYLNRRQLETEADPATIDEGLFALAVIPLRYENQILGALNLASHQHDAIPEHSRVLLESLGAQAAGAIARIKAEQALAESEARLRTLVTGAPVVLFAADKDSTITFQDGQALRAIGANPGENVGRKSTEIFRQNPGLLSNIERVLHGEEFSAIELIGPASFHTCYTPTRDADGAVSGYIGVATNITERQRLERQLLEISDREQARIGQEIHDGLCQQLVSLAFDANTLEAQLGGKNRPESAAAKRLVKYLDLSITEARRLSRGLFPIRLEGEGLPPAIEELLRNTTDRFGLSCEFEIDPSIMVNATVATNLYRIAQEALNNIVKHSRAKRVILKLRGYPSHIDLWIEDNGMGMPQGGSESPTGMGLHIMDYRARIVGGSLRIENRPGGGTIVSCLVPFPETV